jgi:lipoprotein-anchoring transpeptidase ErfK/SrfK
VKLKFILLLFLFLTLNFLVIENNSGKINPKNLQESYNPNAKVAIFNNKKVSIPQNILSNENQNVLGESDSIDPGNKRIEVDLSKQRFYAYEGDKLVYSFLISSGKWGRTPNGDFKIWTKIRSAKMSGGSKLLGDYYYLPNVPYIMYFYNTNHPKQSGFSLHGTYWHHNFGYPMSHGCINMKTEDAQTIFAWATINTPIKIFGQFDYSKK